jgi:two-component system chemotaxis response regulator CheY
LKQILVVDDSATVREQVRVALTSGGYEALEAGDGVEGLQQLATHKGISLVLCDVNMPRMNGLDMLDELRRSGRLATLTFLLLTSEGQPSLIERARRAGAKAWIIKPFQPALLLAAIRKLAA